MSHDPRQGPVNMDKDRARHMFKGIDTTPLGSDEDEAAKRDPERGRMAADRSGRPIEGEDSIEDRFEAPGIGSRAGHTGKHDVGGKNSGPAAGDHRNANSA